MEPNGFPIPVTSHKEVGVIRSRRLVQALQMSKLLPDMAMAPASVTYPDTVTLSYTYSGAGRPVGTAANSVGINFVSNATYAPFGGLTGALYNGGMTVSNSYNHRMQPVFLSASGGAGTIYSLGYDFHWVLDANLRITSDVHTSHIAQSVNFLRSGMCNHPRLAFNPGMRTWGTGHRAMQNGAKNRPKRLWIP